MPPGHNASRIKRSLDKMPPEKKNSTKCPHGQNAPFNIAISKISRCELLLITWEGLQVVLYNFRGWSNEMLYSVVWGNLGVVKMLNFCVMCTIP